MAKYIRIDGTEYKVAITELKRRADILDRYAHRDENGILHREVIGTYINYDLQLYCPPTTEGRTIYNQLFEVLSAPVASHIVEMPNDGIAFEGYFSSIADAVDKIDDYGTRYKGLTCKLTATRPRRVANG